jgi:flagellar biosynthesis protein FlhF
MNHAAQNELGRLLRIDRAKPAGMDVKFYYARSIEEAVDRATYEMGPEAMLLDSRRAPAEARHFGEYEVRFAAPGAGQPQREAAGGLDSPRGPELALEMARMRDELGQIRRMFREKRARRDREYNNVSARLAEAGFAPDIAREVSATVEAARTRPADDCTADELVEIELRRRLDGLAAAPEPQPAAIAVLGPPGSGKTTALVKMAVRYAAAGHGLPVLINTDTFRIGACEQMARYASVLGLPLLTADTPNALRRAIEEQGPRTLLLIDTPGLSGGDLEMFEPAGYFLASRPDLERQLLLPATMHWSDMDRVCAQYERFRPTRLAFTRLDETGRFGGLVSATCRHRLPVSWISAGQRVPDDLETVTADSLARMGAQRHREETAEPARERSRS